MTLAYIKTWVTDNVLLCIACVVIVVGTGLVRLADLWAAVKEADNERK